jgi:hypothetical protein
MGQPLREIWLKNSLEQRDALREVLTSDTQVTGERQQP